MQVDSSWYINIRTHDGVKDEDTAIDILCGIIHNALKQAQQDGLITWFDTDLTNYEVEGD